MMMSTVTSKGQTTLPKPVRLALGVGAGDRVRYVVHGDEVRLLPIRPIGRLFGALKHEGPPASLEDMEHGIAQGVCERYATGVAANRSEASGGASPVSAAARGVGASVQGIASEAQPSASAEVAIE